MEGFGSRFGVTRVAAIIRDQQFRKRILHRC